MNDMKSIFLQFSGLDISLRSRRLQYSANSQKVSLSSLQNTKIIFLDRSDSKLRLAEMRMDNYNIFNVHSQPHNFNTHHGSSFNYLILIRKVGGIGIWIKLQIRRNQMYRHKNLHRSNIRKESHLRDVNSRPADNREKNTSVEEAYLIHSCDSSIDNLPFKRFEYDSLILDSELSETDSRNNLSRSNIDLLMIQN